MNSPSPQSPSAGQSGSSGGRVRGRFSPERLPRLLSPYGVLSRRKFFTDSLILWLIALSLVLALAVLPMYLYERAFFDDLPETLWLPLQAVYLIAVLLCLAVMLWADLCLYVKRLRDAGGHWSIALAAYAGILAFCLIRPDSDEAAFANLFCFALFLLLPPKRRREAVPAQPTGERNRPHAGAFGGQGILPRIPPGE